MNQVLALLFIFNFFAVGIESDSLASVASLGLGSHETAKVMSQTVHEGVADSSPCTDPCHFGSCHFGHCSFPLASAQVIFQTLELQIVTFATRNIPEEPYLNGRRRPPRVGVFLTVLS